MKKKKLGEVLRGRGHISAPVLNNALQEQQGKFVRLGERILERGLVSKRDLASSLTEVSNIPYLDCTSKSVSPGVLRLIPQPMTRRLCVLPLHLEGPRLVAVRSDPQNLQIKQELRFKTGLEVSPRLGFRADIESAIERHYGPAGITG